MPSAKERLCSDRLLPNRVVANYREVEPLSGATALAALDAMVAQDARVSLKMN